MGCWRIREFRFTFENLERKVTSFASRFEIQRFKSEPTGPPSSYLSTFVEVTLRIPCEGRFRKAAREVKAPIARSHCQSRPNRGLYRTSFCLLLRPLVRAHQLNLFEKKSFPCSACPLQLCSSKVHQGNKRSTIDRRRSRYSLEFTWERSRVSTRCGNERNAEATTIHEYAR